MNTIDFLNFGMKACCYIQENKQTSHSCCWSGFCNKIHLIETKWNLYQFMYQKWKWNDNKFDIWKRWLQEAQQIDQNRSYRTTYWLILDVMSECWVSFNPSQICPKVVLFILQSSQCNRPMMWLMYLLFLDLIIKGGNLSHFIEKTLIF